MAKNVTNKGVKVLIAKNENKISEWKWPDFIKTIFTPEGVSAGAVFMAIILFFSYFINEIRKLSNGNTDSKKKDKIIWQLKPIAGQIAINIAPQLISPFYARLQQQREHAFRTNEQTNNEVQRLIREGEYELEKESENDKLLESNKGKALGKLIKSIDYFKAARYFGIANDQLAELYDKDKRSTVSIEILKLSYKEAYCYFKLNKLEKAKQLLNNTEKADKEYTDAINLLALINFRLGCMNDAKDLFDRSFALNSRQSTVYLFHLFLNEKYDEFLEHSPYKKSNEKLLNNDFRLQTYELLLAYYYSLQLKNINQGSEVLKSIIESTVENHPINYIDIALLECLFTASCLKETLLNGEIANCKKFIKEQIKKVENLLEVIEKQNLSTDKRYVFAKNKLEKIHEIDSKISNAEHIKAEELDDIIGAYFRPIKVSENAPAKKWCCIIS